MLRLKDVLARNSIRQCDMAQAISLSQASVAQIINHDLWPRSFERELVQDAIRDYLLGRGVGFAELTGMFENADSPCANTENPQGTTDETKENVMLLRKQGLFPATKKHFSLFRDPFAEDVQSHEDVFVSPDIRYVREAMFQTARHGGFMAVVGESGAGKSTLRRDLIDRIHRENHQIVVIEPYVLGLEDNDVKGKTLKASHIAEAILAACAPLERVMRSSEARFRQVHRVLRDSYRAGNRHVLVIEEAHGLPIPTIKHLKRFFELEDGFKKLLSIVLIGQPELRLKLNETSHEVREVVQRCEVVELQPLDARLDEYLRFKLERIGKAANEVIDTSGIEALRAKLTISGHRRDRRETLSLLYPLAVGNVLTAAMNLAAEIGVPVVNADVVRAV